MGVFCRGSDRTYICQIYLAERIAVPVFGFGIDAAGFHFRPPLNVLCAGEAKLCVTAFALYRAKGNGRNCVIATEIQPAEISEGAEG